MKSNLSLKALTVMALLFCGFFVIQSFTIKSDSPTNNSKESIQIESELEDDRVVRYCRYRIGGVMANPNAPAWFVTGVIICTPCSQPTANHIGCPSPFGTSYSIMYNNVPIGTATNIVGLNKRCKPCQVGEQMNVTFAEL